MKGENSKLKKYNQRLSLYIKAREKRKQDLRTLENEVQCIEKADDYPEEKNPFLNDEARPTRVEDNS